MALDSPGFLLAWDILISAVLAIFSTAMLFAVARIFIQGICKICSDRQERQRIAEARAVKAKIGPVIIFNLSKRYALPVSDNPESPEVLAIRAMLPPDYFYSKPVAWLDIGAATWMVLAPIYRNGDWFPEDAAGKDSAANRSLVIRMILFQKANFDLQPGDTRELTLEEYGWLRAATLAPGLIVSRHATHGLTRIGLMAVLAGLGLDGGGKLIWRLLKEEIEKRIRKMKKDDRTRGQRRRSPRFPAMQMKWENGWDKLSLEEKKNLCFVRGPPVEEREHLRNRAHLRLKGWADEAADREAVEMFAAAHKRIFDYYLQEWRDAAAVELEAIRQFRIKLDQEFDRVYQFFLPHGESFAYGQALSYVIHLHQEHNWAGWNGLTAGPPAMAGESEPSGARGHNQTVKHFAAPEKAPLPERKEYLPKKWQAPPLAPYLFRYLILPALKSIRGLKLIVKAKKKKSKRQPNILRRWLSAFGFILRIFRNLIGWGQDGYAPELTPAETVEILAPVVGTGVVLSPSAGPVWETGIPSRNGGLVIASSVPLSAPAADEWRAKQSKVNGAGGYFVSSNRPLTTEETQEWQEHKKQDQQKTIQDPDTQAGQKKLASDKEDK